MAIQSSIYKTDGKTKTYPSTKHIATKQHCSVFAQKVVDSLWEAISVNNYTLVNNSIIFIDAPLTYIYSNIEIRVADTQDELSSNPSDISIVATNIDSIVIVANDITNVDMVALNIASVTTISGSIANVNSVAHDIANVNIVGNNINNVNTNADNINSINTNTNNIVAIQNASANAISAEASATSAAASYDSFDDRYLGSKTSAPTVDNDGSQLLVGAIYWNSITASMSVWNGTSWVVFSEPANTALSITNIPAGNISSTNVQNALNELDTEKANITSPTFIGVPTAPTATAGTSTTQLATTAFVVGEKGGRRNYLINGNFDKWDYATSQTVTGYGSDNRWNNVNSGSTKTASQQVCGDTERTLFNAMYFSRTVVSSVVGAGSYCYKFQSIENINLLAGKTVTVSFWAKADAPKNIAIELVQVFGTGGSPSSTVTGISSQLVALTTTWQKKTIIVTLPSIIGKTLGTDGVQTTYNSLLFWFDAGSNLASRTANLGQQSGTFDIAQVKIEDGSVATNGWHPYDGEFGGEIQACARYYEKGNGVLLCATSSGNFSGAISIATFKTFKRLVPTVAVVQITGNMSGAFANSIFIDCALIMPSTQASDGQHSEYTWAASAEL
jgi:hypothetical protein